MDEVTSIAYLATVPGAVAVALLVVETAKTMVTGGRVLWRRLAIVAGIGVVVAGTWLTVGLTVESTVLAVVNGLIAGLAASRTYDAAGEYLDRRS